MSQPFKLRYQNEIVGFFVLGAVAAVFVTMALMARSRQWFDTTFAAQIRFDAGNVALISEGMEVRIHSQVIGRVVRSVYDEKNRVVAHVAISTRHQKAVHSDSIAVFYIPLAGLPGQPFIELKGGKSLEPVSVGGRLQGRVAEDLVQLATDVLTDTRLTLRPTLVEVEKLSKRLNAVMDTIAPEKDLPRLTQRMTALLDRVDKVMARADKLITHTDEVVGKVNSGEGLMAKMVGDPKFVRQVVDLIVRMQSAAVSVERTLVTADRVATGADKVLKKTGALMTQAGGAMGQLPGLLRSGKKALADMVTISTQLKRIAPKVPGLMRQIDDVLLETRSVMGAAERHWLLKSTLRPTDSPKPLPGRGLRDAPPIPNDATLRKLLGDAP